MVYCRYCGEKNNDRALKCIKCGEPLSLLPNIYPGNMDNDMHSYRDRKDFDKEFRNNHQNNHDNFNQESIKSRYKNFDLGDPNFDKNKHRNHQINKLNNLSESKNNIYGVNHGNNLKKPNKSYVEWDVVVATALLVIILASILQRFFHTFGLSLALLIGLIYILIATKSKLSLFKAIPLAIFMVVAISAYFSL